MLTKNPGPAQASDRGKRGGRAKRSVIKKKSRCAADELYRIRKLYKSNMRTMRSLFEDDREIREIEHKLRSLERKPLSPSQRELVQSNLKKVGQELHENTPKLVAMSVGFSLQFLRFVLENGIDDREIAIEHVQFAKYIGTEFAKYAEVRASEQFLCEIMDALLSWLRGVRSPNDTHPLLSQMRRNARSLCKQVSLVIEAINRRPNVADPLVNASIGLEYALESVQRAGPAISLEEAIASRKQGARPTILGILEAISLLNKGLDKAMSPLDRVVLRQMHPRAELPNIKGYPGLAAFVFDLECAARRAGGSFTAHRKIGQKGTLIYAVNDLRTYLLRTEWGNALAECLPPPSGHPTAQYERVLHAAREACEKQRRVQ